VDELEEYAEQLQDARAGAPERGGGCGCLGWAAAAILFLVLGGAAVGAWWPLIVMPIAFIVVGAGFWTLFDALRNGSVRRERYDPHTADRRPASPATGGRRDPPAPGPAGGPHTDPLAAPSKSPVALRDPAPPEGAVARPNPAPLVAPSAAPAPTPDLAPDLPVAPQAPDAPQAPAAPDWS
jgi:hypothetical protein